MSVGMMDQVWKRSTQKGTGLLMLLAIADSANDEGEAYPSISTLAKKCRMSERNARLLIAQIERSDELEVRQGQGVPTRGGMTNLFVIKIEHMPAAQGMKQASGVKRTSGGKHTSPLKQTARDEAHFRKGVKPASGRSVINQEEYRHIDFVHIWSEVIGTPFPDADRVALEQLVEAGLSTDAWRAACRRAVESRKVRYNGDTIKRIGYVVKCLESVQGERRPIPVVAAPDFAAKLAANPDYCVECGTYTFGNCEHAGRAG